MWKIGKENLQLYHDVLPTKFVMHMGRSVLNVACSSCRNNICVYWSIPRHMYKKRTPWNRTAIVHINLHNIVNTHKCIYQFTIFHSYVTQVFCSKLICPLPPTTLMHKRISYVICLIGDFPMQNSR
jgi:hypothetical protein